MRRVGIIVIGINGYIDVENKIHGPQVVFRMCERLSCYNLIKKPIYLEITP